MNLLTTQMNTVAYSANFEFTAVPDSPMKLQHNGVGELFVTIGDNTYRMKEHDGRLHVVAVTIDIATYGGCNGILIG